LLLKRLTEATGPSGFEDEIRQVIYEEIRDHVDRVYTDSMGNLIAEKDGTGLGPKVMLCAHMDEVSLMISYIEEDGLLRFRHIGGIDDRVLLAKPVLIGEGRIPGVIGSLPAHLTSSSDREKPVPLDRLRIDIGASTREEALALVCPGDWAVFATQYEPFGQGLAKSKSFDDRVGCAVLVEACKQEYQMPVVFAFTVQEEIGLRGAAPVAYRVKPDLALVLEGTLASDIPGTVVHAQATALGQGPALSLVDSSSIHSRKLRHHLIEVAQAQNIPYQVRNTTAGGNDAGRIHTVHEGVMTCTMSVPCRYIHAPSQVISLDDYNNTVRLTVEFLRSVERGGLER